MNKLVLLASTLLATSVFASPQHSPRPGGIAIIDVGPAAEPAPAASFGGKPALVMRDGAYWKAVVGVPLDSEPGDLAVLVNGNPVSVTLVPHAYSEQRLTIKNQSHVTPGQAQLDRIRGERKIIDAALNNFRDVPVYDIALAAPVSGRRSSSFGLRRFFNDQPRSPHKGMDIAAGSGTPIKTPLAGVVTATGDFFFNGNTVIVDHGQG